LFKDGLARDWHGNYSGHESGYVVYVDRGREFAACREEIISFGKQERDGRREGERERDCREVRDSM